MTMQGTGVKNDYRFFCRNCQDMIATETCLARRKETAGSEEHSCAGCSKDTMITRTTRGMLRTPNSRV